MTTTTKTHRFGSILMGLAFLLCLVGCNQTTQTTSGQDYLSRYPASPTGATDANLDAEVREIAAVEPLLRFPARIGLAKVANGKISNLTEAEFAAWEDAKAALGTEFGEFIPVSPLVAEMVYRPSGGSDVAAEIVRKIRLGAARQHLDAVLIYEVFSRSDQVTLPTAVANWTIIGAYIVPSEQTETVGHANALLVDVRNGYPYGTASASAERKDLSTLVGNYDRKRKSERRAQDAATFNLIPEVVGMMETLRRELPRTAQAR